MENVRSFLNKRKKICFSLNSKEIVLDIRNITIIGINNKNNKKIFYL